MNRAEVRTLREKRAKLAEDAKNLIPKAGEQWTPENRKKFDDLHKEIDAIGVKIEDAEREERQQDLDTNLAQPRQTDPLQRRELADDPREKREFVEPGYRALFDSEWAKLSRRDQHRRAFIDYCYRGLTKMGADERNFLETGNGRFTATPEQLRQAGIGPKELRDMGISTNTLGGYFVPQGFVYDVFEAKKWYGGMVGEAETMDTATGNPMPYPTDNDVANAAHVIGEGTQVNETDVTISHLILNAWMYTTDEVKVSLQLLQDSAFDMEGYLKKKFGIRFGRGLNHDLTLGTGSNQPNGIVTALLANGATPEPASSGVQYGQPLIAAGSSANTGGSETGGTSIGSQDLEDLEATVDPAYRQGAKYMFHDQTRRVLARLLDKYGRPLWKAGIAVGEPNTIGGYPYVINNDLATIAVNATTMLFGNFKAYIYRRVKELAVLRLDERYADYAQVAFLAFARFDGQLVDPGNHPISYLKQASS